MHNYNISSVVLKKILLRIFISMASTFCEYERHAEEHLKKCDYVSPAICGECNAIFNYMYKKYNICSYTEMCKFLGVTPRYNQKMFTDRLFFLESFKYLIQKHLSKYTYSYYISREDFTQDAYVIMLELFDRSRTRLTNPKMFVSYISRIFPLLLKQKFKRYKKKYKNIFTNNFDGSSKIIDSGNEIIHSNNDDLYLVKEDFNDILLVAENILKDMTLVIFKLYYKEGFTIDDISSLISMDKPHISNKLYFARKLLKETIVNNRRLRKKRKGYNYGR